MGAIVARAGLSLALRMNDYLGKGISDLCSSSLAKKNASSHCAHFVSHVLGYSIAGSATCKNLTWKDKKDKAVVAASIRVDEIFNKSTATGLWSEKPTALSSCLMFATISTNMKNKKMSQHPRKHIGIVKDGRVWNYSNTHDKVVAETPEYFVKKFDRSYKTSGATVVYYYGKFLP